MKTRVPEFGGRNNLLLSHAGRSSANERRSCLLQVEYNADTVSCFGGTVIGRFPGTAPDGFKIGQQKTVLMGEA